MKKYLIFYFFLSVLIGMAGCQEEVAKEPDGGKGWLVVEFLTDKSVQTRATDPVYTLDILDANGTLVKHFDDFTGITDRILLSAGTYKLIADSGEDVLADFDKPYYKAEQEVKIEAAVTKEVSLICTQANVKVSVEYSDLIRKNFPEYSLEVTNGEGKLTFVKDEVRAGYLRVNENTLIWNLTLNNGQEVFHLNKTITGVAPRQYYRFKFDIKENGSAEEGAFVGGVVVDTTTDVYDWVCDIVLKENIVKPDIQREDGKALSEPILVLEKARGADIRVNISAQARMQDLTIRHKSATLKEKGVPEAFTITDIQPEVQTAVNNAGITWGSETLLNAQEAVIDFSQIANHLPLGDYQFYINVYDARCRLVTDTLRISVIPDIDHIADEVNVMEVWAEFATVRGRWYTIDKPEGMGLEYKTTEGDWQLATAMTFDETGKSFVAFLTNLEPGTTYFFRTTATEKGASETIRTFTTEAGGQIPYMNFDHWYTSSKAQYVGNSDDAVHYWDSGNEGGATFGFVPTTEEKSDVVKGSAAKLASQWAMVKFAAGNLYTGDFVGLSGTDASIDFGIPYTSRPTTLSGWYKYQPGTINRTKAPYTDLKGLTDSCHIYIALTDWSEPFHANSSGYQYVDLSENNTSILAFGELKSDRRMEAYEHFTIQLKYRNKTKKPTYILIVAAASKYGDYFTGSDSSVLWLDEFELGFDPIE